MEGVDFIIFRELTGEFILVKKKPMQKMATRQVMNVSIQKKRLKELLILLFNMHRKEERN